MMKSIRIWQQLSMMASARTRFLAASQFSPSHLLLGIGILIQLTFLFSLTTGWLNPLFNDSMHRFGPGVRFLLDGRFSPRRHRGTERMLRERPVRGS
jgi:hypothetical protein